MSGGFKSGGKVHRILERLSAGPATRTELAALIRGPNQTHHRARIRIYPLLTFLHDQGLTWSAPGVVMITVAGMEALDALGPLISTTNHRPIGAPNARIFARKEAA